MRDASVPAVPPRRHAVAPELPAVAGSPAVLRRRMRARTAALVAAPVAVLLVTLGAVLPGQSPASPVAATPLAIPVVTAAMPAVSITPPPLQDAPVPSVRAEAPSQPAPLDDRLLAGGDAPPLARVFGLGVRTVVVDPGHGGSDPGAVAATGLREKAVTLAVARALAGLLRDEANLDVVLTRSTDETVPLSRRVAIANAARADLFVSIHVNTLPNPRVNAIETYYFGTPVDADALRLAELENVGSELPMAAFRALVEKLGATLKRQESLALARSLQTGLIDHIGSGTVADAAGQRRAATTYDGGVRVGPFVVLLGVEAPAVLTEIGCLSNRRAAQNLDRPEYQARIARALAAGIAAYVRNRTQPPTPVADTHPDGAAENEQSATEGASRGQDSG